MDSDVVLKVEGLSKKFCRSLKRSMAYGTLDITRSMLGIPYNQEKLRPGEFWALDDVSFEVKRGDKLGFLGVNGSGKSTLLRLINGIFPPDKGRITVKGKIGALIAVGVGFHPHMTGRENIYLNGTILGMTKKEIQKKLDSIIDFAEIGDFLDAPVSTYSSGMTVRLGFSIAIHCEPDILLVDEVLAVGDLGFALKCCRKMSEYRQNGGTFILVSHNMQMIRNTCDKAIWLEHGRIVESGEIFSVCDKYESRILRNSHKSIKAQINNDNIFNYDDDVKITKVEFLDEHDNVTKEFKMGDRFKVRIHYCCLRDISKPFFSLSVTNQEGIIIFENYSDFNETILSKGKGYVDFTINQINLRPNVYSCTVTLAEGEILNQLEWHDKAYTFCVVNERLHVNQGAIYPYANWQVFNG